MLTRENLRSGVLHRMLREQGHETWTPEQIRASMDETLRERDTSHGVWVFGYASLIWNPAFHYAERVQGRIHGHHRRFCLWTVIGRGSQDCPGLMMGLERGGSCRGVAYRVAPEAMDEELYVVWSREMVTGSYCPRWVTVDTVGGERVPAVAFVINHAHERYAGQLDDAVAARAIAEAHGPLGRCCEYLFNTVAHLDEMGIPDRRLHRLARMVEDIQQGRAT